MSQSIRQSSIFAGEEWTVLYKAFTNIDFTSYDPPTIQAALQTYLQTNYPESFNDWIASDEYVAIIDVLSWLAGSLSFRADINARENFLETASARESILRLAQFLSYNPRRGNSARGLIKVTQIKTTEAVEDSYGTDLSNKAVKWNDPDDPDWLDKFENIINCTLPVSNKIGTPSVKTVLSNINTETYPIQCATNSSCVYKFNSKVDSKQEVFEICNTTISDSGFIEHNPNPSNNFDIIYRLDGKGYGSQRSGFFFFFKQGELKSQTVNLPYQQENRVVTVESKNISETDVWVQSVDDYGNIVSSWTKVPGFVGENVTFNSLSTDLRNIYTINTETNDAIGIRFGDGRFGNIPYGNVKIWYRTINNKQYTVKPKDMEAIQISIPYFDLYGRTQTVTFTLSLQEEIANAINSETTEQIRYRASQVYSTQNRMVSGEDYNLYPLSTNEITKLKAVNRIYSGQSRYLDIIDPTATFQDVVLFCDDGKMSTQTKRYYSQIPLASSLTTEQIIKDKIQIMAEHAAIRNLVRDLSIMSFTSNFPIWSTDTSTSISKGKFSNAISLSYDQHNILKASIHQGGSLYFEYTVNGVTLNKWVTIVSTDISVFSYDADILANNIWLSDSVPNGALLKKVIPVYRTNFSTKITTVHTYNSEFAQIQNYINSKKSFKIYYNPKQPSILIDDNSSIPGIWYITDYSATPNAAWIPIIDINYVASDCWEISSNSRGYHYIFTSERNVRFTTTSFSKKLDGTLQTEVNDTISVITGPGKEIMFDIVDNVRLPDGTIDNSSVVITPALNKNSGGYMNPDAFNTVKAAYSDTVLSTSSFAVYKNKITNNINSREYVYDTFLVILPTDSLINSYMNSQEIYVNLPKPVYGPAEDFKIDSKMLIVAPKSDGTYRRQFVVMRNIYAYDPITWAASVVGTGWVNGNNTGGEGTNMTLQYSYSAVFNEFATKVNYKWKHYSGLDVRINPSITNIVDIFTLTSEYDYNIRKWISEGMTEIMPESPDSYMLKNQFSALENYKMFSDEIVWRPVHYKFLFGTNAAASLRCKFNVIKLPSATISDGEIKAKIVSYINEYFDVNKWDFGETFFFTELSAFIHYKMSTYISTIVLVPLDEETSFGHMFQVKCEPNELFISSASVDDIQIVSTLSNTNMRML